MDIEYCGYFFNDWWQLIYIEESETNERIGESIFFLFFFFSIVGEGWFKPWMSLLENTKKCQPVEL